MNRTTRFLFLLALTLVAVAPLPGQDIDVDDFVKGWIEKQRVPAVAIAVVKDGSVIKAAGYGLADVENKIPARPDTVFKIGSVSKQFIAAGIMLLVQDGRIAVDDKVSKYLDGTPTTWQAITLRHLLTHGRAFPYGFGWQLDDWPADSPVPTGVPMIRHGGSMNGFRAGYSRWPGHRLAVIVLTNLTNAPYEGLAANIAIRCAAQLKTPARLPAPSRR